MDGDSPTSRPATAVARRRGFDAATRKLLATAAILVGSYLLAAFVIFVIESSSDGALIKTFPQALWYTLVTMSTVGYGDLYPVSAAGRIAASVLILGSVAFIGFIIGRFGDLAVERNRRRFLGMDGTTFTHHTIIIGWNELARIVAKELIAAGFKVAALTNSEKDIVEMRSMFPDPAMFYVTFGILEDDEAYRRMNIGEADGAILLTGDDTKTLITALELRRLSPAIKVTAYIQNSALKKTIENAGVSYVISPNEVVGRMIASAMFEPDVSSFLEDILATTTGDDDLDVQEFRLAGGHELVGMPVKSAAARLEDATGAQLLTISRNVSGSFQVLKNDRATEVLQADDYLIVMANQNAATRTAGFLGVKQGRR